MSLNTISTKELRENFNQVLSAMESGQSLTLLYRSKPLAEIKPLKSAKTLGRNFSQVQINRWLKADRLSPRERQRINDVIDRLP